MDKKIALAAMAFFLSIPFLITGVTERGAPMVYHSAAVGSGNNYTSSIHIFNPNSEPTEYTLNAFTNSGLPNPMLTNGLTTLHTFTGILFPHQSVHYRTNGAGLGANAGNVQLSGTGPLAAWNQTSQASPGGDLAARETTPLVNVDAHAWVLPRVQTFATSAGPNPTVGYIGLRNTEGFSDNLQLDLLDATTGALAATRTIVIQRRETIFSSVGDLMGVADLNKEYLLRTRAFSSTRVLPYYMAIRDGQVLSQYLGTTAGFSPVVLRGGNTFSETLPFFHLGMNGVSADYAAVSNFPGAGFTGSVTLYEASVPGSSTEVALVAPSAFFDASAALGDPSADEYGTVSYNETTLGLAATGHVKHADASTLFGPSQPLSGRGIISIDASSLDGLEQSRLILHNHQSVSIRLALGMLDEDGTYLQVINQDLAPGLTAMPLFDLVHNLPDTRALLIETSPSNAWISADLIIHGADTPTIEGVVLDRVPTIALGGNRTIGNYPEIIVGWANSGPASCLGANATVADIVNYLGNGYTCP